MAKISAELRSYYHILGISDRVIDSKFITRNDLKILAEERSRQYNRVDKSGDLFDQEIPV
jgi:hypothetical protein